MSCLGLCSARTAGHSPLHMGSFVSYLQTMKVLCTCALQPQTQYLALIFRVAIRTHRWALHVLWRHLSAKSSELPQVLSMHISPVYPVLHFPRNGTVMMQIHLKSTLQDEQSWWQWKASQKRMCYCWMTPLTEASLRLAKRQVKYFPHLKALMFSQSLFQYPVVWGETRHFNELSFVWKTERRKTGKCITGWRSLETRQKHFYSPHHHNAGLMWWLGKMLNYATIPTHVLLHLFWTLECSWTCWPQSELLDRINKFLCKCTYQVWNLKSH